MTDPRADPWLTLIGLGEDGLNGLPPASRAALDAAEIVFGGPRHLDLARVGDRGRAWPVPFSVAPVLAWRGRKVVVLASGDPFWHGAGGTLARHLLPGEWHCLPAPSCFALAAARLGWRLEDVLCLGLHAVPFDRLRPILHEGARVLCTLRDGAAAGELAAWLTAHGFGASRLTVCEALGGPRERLRNMRADADGLGEVAAPALAAIEARGAPGLPRATGLPDDVFQSDGQITKRPVRALTLSALAPRPGQHLWDIGAGSGSVSVEFCLAAPGATATALEARADRAANIRANAARFGLDHRIFTVEGRAPEALDDLPAPDAVFVGGGATEALLATLWDRLSPGTRLVMNAVTLETEALLIRWHGLHGGHLLRAELSEAGPLGTMHGWHPARPVTQWVVTR
ncbi:precorrin-6y C5,15-methyltransferase (decarboxylating) subunit CbiE [Rhodobacteraceae bacterium W635]|uniref:precorrin-6y C5,15-methyltransferase (decarboxylating) subunit CbiE n=1 Tax=Nioella halotolerans TaxID=2303578 RepID=UPI000E3CF0DF|nr:precorrin-6y C5,15-methyltransferase (decarboxylating) subunit CbiE [Rhodobacteraceae bacterium W635]